MNTVRRIASQILRAGENRIKFKPEAIKKIGEALTREDVRALIKDGSVFAEEKRGVSRLGGRERAAQHRKGRRFGKGSKKGTQSARLHPKISWMAKMRVQRALIRSMFESGQVTHETYRKIYMMVKGNSFKGVKMLEIYLKDNKLLK